MELNPNHPVTRQVHNEWHKLCAFAMFITGLDSVEITEHDINDFVREYPNGAVVCDTRGGRLILRLVNGAEGERLAREEGGLPV